jgi:hypothetical protein
VAAVFDIIGVLVILLLSSGHGHVDVAKFISAEVIALIVLALLALIPAIFATTFFILGERFWEKRVTSRSAFVVGFVAGALALGAAFAYFAQSKELSIHNCTILAVVVLLGLPAVAFCAPLVAGRAEED